MSTVAPQFVIPAEFPITMLCGVVLCIECFLCGMNVGLKARPKAFNKDFMEQFKEVHHEAFPGSDPAVGGHPDAGDGRYSDKLEYKDWVEFNNAMRVHVNFTEMLPVILVTLVLGGLFVPQVTMWVAIINTIARAIYATMYISKGSDSRVLGAVGGSLPLYIILIWATVKIAILAFN